MIYGDPQVHIDDDHTDRIGIRTLVLSQLWQPSRWPLTLPELDDEKPDVPEVPGGVMFIGEQTRRVAGALRTTWTFEGINGDGKSVTFKDRANSPDYSFEPGFAQVSILKHPSWPHLRDAYGGQVIDGQVIWPEFIGPSTASGPVKDDSAGKPNPLFGHEDFFRLEGTYSFRYASKDLGVAMQGIGYIVGAPPGAPPPVGDGRNWLKAPTPWKRRGPVLDITEVYWLSGAGGWPPQLYGNEAQSYSSNGGGVKGINTLTGEATFSAPVFQ
jgi:hypothetical protein